jgi:multiple sugar transport system substrate-binding protein
MHHGKLRWLGFLLAVACGPERPAGPVVVTVSGSVLGAEGQVLRRQLERFDREHPGIRLEPRPTPDAADLRHQLYVQWLNARAGDPDILQLDAIWTPEFAAAGWILPLEPFGFDTAAFFPATIEANRWDGKLFAAPWFVDVGMLYYRTDLVPAPPRTWEALEREAKAATAKGTPRYGLVWQGARYEGLVTVFLEYLGGFGGRILEGGRVTVHQRPGVQALTTMRDQIHRKGVSPARVLTWHEEEPRFAFQNGEAAFMRNWPYAWTLLQDERRSRVANKIGVAPMPAAAGGQPSAALGGAQLAINRYTHEPELAAALVAFLTAPAQMLERARVATQLPARRSLYESDELARILPMPIADIRAALEATVARPVTPVYSEMSEILQVHLHRVLTLQEQPSGALHDAAREIRVLLERSGLRRDMAS